MQVEGGGPILRKVSFDRILEEQFLPLSNHVHDNHLHIHSGDDTSGLRPGSIVIPMESPLGIR